MNSSPYGQNVSTAVIYRDSYSTAVAKNVIIVALGLIINYINGSLVHTFTKHQIFYMNPRYILFIHLVVNDMIQLTSSINLFVLSYIFYKINASLCCVFMIFLVFTTHNSPLNLAVMAVECYIAICLPLRYAKLCTIKRTYILIGWIWILSVLTTLPDVFLVVATEPVQFLFSTISCRRKNIFRHPFSILKRDSSDIIYLICVWLTLLYTYFQIFFAAKSAKGDAKKARNTILLHSFQLILCMLTYIFYPIQEALMYLFPKHRVDIVFVCYIITQVLPRFVSPMVYGIRDKTFRQHLKNHLLRTVRQCH